MKAAEAKNEGGRIKESKRRIPSYIDLSPSKQNHAMSTKYANLHNPIPIVCAIVNPYLIPLVPHVRYRMLLLRMSKSQLNILRPIMTSFSELNY